MLDILKLLAKQIKNHEKTWKKQKTLEKKIKRKKEKNQAINQRKPENANHVKQAKD